MAQYLSREKVHSRAADEAGHKHIGGPVVQRQGRADLLDLAVAQDHNPVRQRHGLDLIVRDIDHGRQQPGMQLAQLRAHRDTQLSVKIGQRLVKQKQLGLAHDGPAYGHALALTAGELCGFALQQVLQAQLRGGRLHFGLNLGFVFAQVLQAESHVVVNRHVRVQRVRLKHHGAAAVRGRHGVDVDTVNQDVARRGRLQPRDDAQQGGLAAARGADENDKLAVFDLQVNAMQDGGAVKAFDDTRKL